MEGFEKFSVTMVEATAKAAEPHSKDEWKELAQIMQNHLLDLDGPTVLRQNLSNDERFLQKIFYRFIEISDSYERLLDIETYLTKFPYGNSRITKTRHLRFIVEAYLQETYILKERLISFLKILSRSYRSSQIRVNVDTTVKAQSAMVLRSLEGLIAVRSFHVHTYRFSDKQIDQLKALESLTTILKPDESGDYLELLKQYYRALYREHRKGWLRKVKDNNRTILELLNACFENLLQVMFDQDGKLIYPNSSST
jgi:hypothetical protein